MPIFNVKRFFLTILIFIVSFCTVIESIKLDLPIVDSTRKLSTIVIISTLFLFSINPKKRQLLKEILTNYRLFSPLLFFFTIILSSAINPPVANPIRLEYFLLTIPTFLVGAAVIRSNQRPEKIIRTGILSIYAAVIFSGILSLSVMIFPRIAIPVMQSLFPKTSSAYALYDFGRGRINAWGIISLTAPLALWGLIKKNHWMFILSWIFIILLTVATFATNYRSQIFVLLIGFITIAGTINGYNPKLYLQFVFTLSVTVMSSFFITVLFLPTNVFSRIISPDKTEIQSLIERKEFIKEAFSILPSIAIFGTGIGNYSLYSKPIILKGERDIAGINLPSQVHEKDPHNSSIFFLVETGILGVTSYFYMLATFFKQDLKLIRHYNNPGIFSLIASSWLYILGTNLNPYPLQGWLYFFLLRGIIFGANLNQRAFEVKPSLRLDY